jgi:hypothetical protein
MVGAKSILTGKGEVKKISTEISTGFPIPERDIIQRTAPKKDGPGGRRD